jgi:hypothetical protein
MANSYKILSKQRLDDVLRIEIEYNFDGRLVLVSVPIFRPTTLQEVRDALRNRGISERAKLLAADSIDTVLPNIPLNEEVVIGG